MTDEQRAELKRLAEAAGGKPWKFTPFIPGTGWVEREDSTGLTVGYDGEWAEEEGRFAAAANPAAVLALLAEVAALKAENAAMRTGYQEYLDAATFRTSKGGQAQLGPLLVRRILEGKERLQSVVEGDA